MKNDPNPTGLELICIIVKFGLASKIIKYAKQYGITGGTIFLAKGTIQNSIWEFFGLTEVRREIVLMVSEKSTAYTALGELNNRFHFDKPNHGIAFSTSVTKILGAKNLSDKENNESRGVENPMYDIIFVVVNRGKGEVVVDAANKAGSRGATIINARGSGIHETCKVFAMEIEPEKEIVLILSQKHLTEPITTSIREDLEIDKPGNGIIFIQEANKTFGLY